MKPFWLEIAVGATLGLGLSVAFIRWLAPLGWTDHPDDCRKHHSKPTARTGGVVLWVVLILAQLWGLVPFRLHWVDWLAIHTMAFMGLLDDRFDLRPRLKAFVGLVMALALAGHVTLSTGGVPAHVPFLGLNVPTHPALLLPLLAFWFWAMPQAYNLIDGINGLSMGFAALLLGVLGWNLGGQWALLWGALAAILVLNFPKAHHFLGDCGALMLGTLFAVLGVEAFALKAPDLLLWVFAYPIVDVTLVVCIRWWKEQPLGGADRSHLHHWMMDHVGRRSRIATPILLCIAALPMLRAIPFPGHLPLSLLGVLALLLLALKAFKDRVSEPVRKAEVTSRVSKVVPFIVPPRLKEAGSGTHTAY